MPATAPALAPSPIPRPEPELRILSIQSAGGGEGFIDFLVEITNVGTRFSRCVLTAHVGDTEVQCQPPVVDLEPQKAPTRPQVIVPRPQLGNLVPAFNNEPTLYNETLRVEARDGEHLASGEWREKVYSFEENPERHRVQQRVWRIGRGEDTPDDHRAEALEQIMRRRDEELGRGSDYDW